MAAPNDSKLTRVRVSTTSGGTYTNVGYARSVDVNRGSEGDVTLRWFGGDGVLPGDKTLDGSIPVWLDDADTLGQVIMNAAYTAGTSVWIQFAPFGTTVGLKVKQFEAYITQIAMGSDSEGDAVQSTFTYRGVPSTYTEPTLA